MKRLRMRSVVLLAGALLLAAPAVTTLTGCGGSSQPQLQVFNNMAVDLGNGQTATLSLSVRGTSLTGTLVVPPPPASVGQPRTEAIGFTIQAGTYTITGTFTAPRGFTAQGTFPAPIGAFTVTGQIPTQTEAGSFTFTANGQTVTGIIPPLSTPTATPTGTSGPTPTPTNVTTSDKLSVTLSSIVGANVTGTTVNLPMHAAKIQDTPTRDFVSAFEDQSGALWRTVTIELQRTTNLAAGQTFTFGGGNTLTFFEAENGNVAATAKNWDAAGGTLHIDTVTATRVTYTLQNVHLAARAGDHATGSFNVNGTASTLRDFGFGG